MRKKISDKPKKKTRPPKFDYESKEFLDHIEGLSQKGYTDKNIAFALVQKYGDTLNAQYFNELKNEKIEGTEKLTERAYKISEALARGREKINLFARDTYFKAALGGKKTKDIYRVFAERKCECGGSDMDCPLCNGTGRIISDKKAITQEVEREMPPNLQALGTWLFNHDEEWRKSVIEGKKLDVTTNGKDMNPAIQVEIIDRREQIENPDDTGL